LLVGLILLAAAPAMRAQERVDGDVAVLSANEDAAALDNNIKPAATTAAAATPWCQKSKLGAALVDGKRVTVCCASNCRDSADGPTVCQTTGCEARGKNCCPAKIANAGKRCLNKKQRMACVIPASSGGGTGGEET
jgi:hypothetical protein